MLTKYTHYIIFPWGKPIQFRTSEDKETRHNIQDIVGTRKCYHINTRPFKFNPTDTERNGGGRGKGAGLIPNIQF